MTESGMSQVLQYFGGKIEEASMSKEIDSENEQKTLRQRSPRQKIQKRTLNRITERMSRMTTKAMTEMKTRTVTWAKRTTMLGTTILSRSRGYSVDAQANREADRTFARKERTAILLFKVVWVPTPIFG